ncbi:MAG: Rpn family recombination-promoting nuclease/putative transposase [Rhodocyclales bacterium]|nr:Rpn family recombination-promoting nuclease/putative transposase [Rhodocyclales bacterium]
MLPIVFYTGEVRWNASTDLAELLPQDLPPELAKYLPRMSYVLIDENAYTDEALAGLKNVVAATIRLKRQQRPQDLARPTEALHRWFAGDAELERILSVWIQEYLLRDLRPELNVPEAHDLGQNHHVTGRTIQTVGTGSRPEGVAARHPERSSRR